MKKFIAFLGILFCFSTANIFAQAQEKKPILKEEIATFSVEGMSCQGCAFRVESALEQVNGVTKYDVSVKNSKAIIRYNTEKTDKKKIGSALKSTGFKISKPDKTDKEPDKKKDAS